MSIFFHYQSINLSYSNKCSNLHILVYIRPFLLICENFHILLDENFDLSQEMGFEFIHIYTIHKTGFQEAPLAPMNFCIYF